MPVPKYGGLALFLGLAWLDVAYGQRGLRWNIAMAIGSVGFLLWGIARVQLGKSFSATARAKELVAAGLYSKLRHPVQLFSALG